MKPRTITAALAAATFTAVAYAAMATGPTPGQTYAAHDMTQCQCMQEGGMMSDEHLKMMQGRMKGMDDQQRKMMMENMKGMMEHMKGMLGTGRGPADEGSGTAHGEVGPSHDHR